MVEEWFARLPSWPMPVDIMRVPIGPKFAVDRRDTLTTIGKRRKRPAGWWSRAGRKLGRSLRRHYDGLMLDFYDRGRYGRDGGNCHCEARMVFKPRVGLLLVVVTPKLTVGRLFVQSEGQEGSW